MWHKPCRTFHPWCPCIKTRCLYVYVFKHGLEHSTNPVGGLKSLGVQFSSLISSLSLYWIPVSLMIQIIMATVTRERKFDMIRHRDVKAMFNNMASNSGLHVLTKRHNFKIWSVLCCVVVHPRPCPLQGAFILLSKAVLGKCRFDCRRVFW